MKSYYYSCKVTDEKTEQSLNDYEADLEYKPKWSDLAEAIKINLEVVKNQERNPWVDRELFLCFDFCLSNELFNSFFKLGFLISLIILIQK